MPKKWNDQSHAEKLFRLFALFLFSDESHSLTELSREINCSKQTVQNLIFNIENVCGMKIEQIRDGQKLFFKGKKLKKIPAAQQITKSEIKVMQMCRIFGEHLLGKDFIEQAKKVQMKSAQLLPDSRLPPEREFGSFHYGTIDYTPFQDIIRRIINATGSLKVCKISYRALRQKNEKIFHIKPLKLFSHKNTLYLHARLAKSPGKRYRSPRFDPLIAVHRIMDIELTDTLFEFPDDYSFDKVFKQSFGIIKDEKFKVTITFTGWAKYFVSERIWSIDQKIRDINDDEIELTFISSSKPEVTSWILSFGQDAKVLKPAWLVKEVRQKAECVAGMYGG